MSKIDAVVLCGGRGTRLASVVAHVPKPLAPVHGKPFLDYVLDYLAASGRVGRVVLASGHLADAVRDGYPARYHDMALAHSVEPAPLGTGGAALLALAHHRLTDPFLLLNGDSYADADLSLLLERHGALDAAITLALSEVGDTARFGTVRVAGGRLEAFCEKSGVAAPGLINAGIYVVSHAALAPWRGVQGALSLEREVLPALVAQGRVGGVRSGTRFIDIGLPETYGAAGGFFAAPAGP